MELIKGGNGEFEILAMSLPFGLNFSEEFIKAVGKKTIGAFSLGCIENAGRTCYQSEKKETGKPYTESFIKMMKDRGHHSVLEHSSLTIKFSKVSRGFTHELVRHRLASFSQESTRYVDESNFEFVLPPFINKDDLSKINIPINLLDKDAIPIEDEFYLDEVLEIIKQTYEQLQSLHGWKKQDARQFLPIGITNDIVITANFREWMHILELRTSKAAHWEIRSMMINVLADLQSLIPIIFDDLVISDDVDSYGIKWAIKSVAGTNKAKKI
jgi:thymidylate synthase (FAD)